MNFKQKIELKKMEIKKMRKEEKIADKLALASLIVTVGLILASAALIYHYL